ncbi:putative lipoprotein [Treponema primitia ZAS-2]|uniref:Putative lipoprotein n=1 Tax=Treponema primitia (strain ATCC BAA-887 / DSM 12427 / ZAS-2) TaxID=545694 RepID=F5YHC9_TREPZ|nr:hypothetical protein [Treponema primitia]AEF84859.1 putative lipoprotein [Treponema primitia ZAS-2]
MKKYVFRGITVLALACGLILSACSNPTGGGGNNSWVLPSPIPQVGNGILTINDIPGGIETFAVYISSDEITSADYTSLLTSYVALGAVTETSSDSVAIPLYTSDGTTTFSGNGTYSILVISSTGSSLVRAVNNKTFANGSVTISWADLQDLSSQNSTNGTLTINDVPTGTGTFAVYITTSEISSSNYTSILTSYVALGAVTGSNSGSVTIPLYTTSGGTSAFSNSGTYSILVISSTGSSLVRAVNNRTFANGSATISWANLQDLSSQNSTNGTLTINDVPTGTGTFAVYITTSEISSSNYTSILTSYVALGAVTGSNSGSVTIPLYTTSGGTSAFSSSGTYSILVISSTGSSLVRAVNNRTFANGSATISWADLQNLSNLGGEGGILTINDVPSGTGTFAVYITVDEITSATTSIPTSYVAIGAVTGSSGSVALPLYTITGGTAFNGTGYYSILVFGSTGSGLIQGVNDIEFTNGGAEISWNDLQNVSSIPGTNAIPLKDNVWYDNTITDGASHEYQFYAQQGKSYLVSWNDGSYGNGTKTGDIKVSASWKGGTSIFSSESYGGFNYPKLIEAEKSGYIKIKVEKRDYYNPGTYGLIYWESQGVLTVQIGFKGPNDITVSGDLKLDISDNNSITLSVGDASAYSGFKWIIDGAELSGQTSSSITLSASVYNTPGVYHLTAVAYQGVVPYSREISFAVVP